MQRLHFLIKNAIRCAEIDLAVDCDLSKIGINQSRQITKWLWPTKSVLCVVCLWLTHLRHETSSPEGPALRDRVSVKPHPENYVLNSDVTCVRHSDWSSLTLHMTRAKTTSALPVDSVVSKWVLMVILIRLFMNLTMSQQYLSHNFLLAFILVCTLVVIQMLWK